jgi:hypothetical protein
MADPNKPEDKLYEVLNAIAEHLANANDEALKADAEAEPRPGKNSVKKTLFDALLAVRKERLQSAVKDAQDRAAALRETAISLPPTITRQRAILESALMNRPDMKDLTLQGRDFKSLSDGDVEGLLRQLHQLGLLDLGDSGTKK